MRSDEKVRQRNRERSALSYRGGVVFRFQNGRRAGGKNKTIPAPRVPAPARSQGNRSGAKRAARTGSALHFERRAYHPPPQTPFGGAQAKEKTKDVASNYYL